MPWPRQKFGFGFGCIGRFFDELNHRVDIGKRHGFTFGDVAFMTRFFQAEQGAAGNHFAAVAQEFGQNLLQIQQARLAVDQSHHVDAEAVLQLGEFVELVEHDFGVFVALQFDHHAHTGFVGFVA